MKQLIKDLDRILKNYNFLKEDRKILIEKIIHKFENKDYIKYPLNDQEYLILVKDDRKLKNLKRYSNSPLPLLSNIGMFSNSVGCYNKTLLNFDIKSREKLTDHPSNHSATGSQIFLVHYNSVNSKGNRYLKHQYSRLTKLRSQKRVLEYWKVCFYLMKHSWSFKIACLNSWMPNWYKTLSFVELKQIYKELNKILNWELLETKIKNVWIESPRTKWRQLCIPPKSWRLYMHMLNIFLSYIYEPYLSKGLYEGFIYNRGSLSWWKDVLWSPLLSQYANIVEVDLSSGFPCASLQYLRQTLETDKLIPRDLINLFLTYLKSPQVESKTFPSLESYIENRENVKWRASDRNLPMGVALCPLLFVIFLHGVLKSIPLPSPEFTYKFYADDGSFYFSLKGLKQLLNSLSINYLWLLKELIFLKNPLLSVLNNLPQFKSSGVRLCLKKSGWVRLFGIWLRPYQSLGLRLHSPSVWQQLYKKLTRQNIELDLYGWTRGRSENLQKRKSSTKGSRTLLHYTGLDGEILNLNSLKSHYQSYFGLLMSKLYASPPNPLSSSLLLQSKKSIYSYYKSELRKKKNNKLLRTLDQSNIGCKLSEIMWQINNNQEIPLEWKLLDLNLERKFKFEWDNKLLSEFPILPNPLRSKEDNEETYFHKYSELKLSKQRYESLKTEYLKTLQSKET